MAVRFKDYYATLGVERTASQEEIQRAFRKLAAKWHPDVNQAAGAEARFKGINEAYEVLKDKEKRARYDQLGADWREGQEFTPPPGFDFRGLEGEGFGDFADLGDLGGFSEFFASLFGGRRRRPQPQAILDLTLEQATRGGHKTVVLGGEAVDEGGRIVPHERQLEIAIPAHTREGTRLRVPGHDLVLVVRLLPHDRFNVQGSDLHTIVQVAPWEAALGAEVGLQGLTGTIRLKVPPGSQGGRRLRLRGQGLAGDGGRGDLYVTLRIVLPEPLGDADRDLLRRWQQSSSWRPERSRRPQSYE
jgi:curved DNA-binding protein